MTTLRARSPREALGEASQNIADGLCYARLIGAGVIAAYNFRAKRPRNWSTAVALGIVYSTDKADGIFARLSAKWLKRPPTNAGKTLDQSIDKIAHYVVTGSQAYNAWDENENLYSLSLLGAFGIQLCRDAVVNHKRRQTDKRSQLAGLPIHIGSIPSSKRKMMVVAAADIATQTPLSDYSSGRFMIGLAHAAGTIMSLTSGTEIIDQINQGLAAAGISQSAELNNQ